MAIEIDKPVPEGTKEPQSESVTPNVVNQNNTSAHPQVQAPQTKPAPQQASHQQGKRTMNTSPSSRQNYGFSRAATSHAMRQLLEGVDKIAEGVSDTPVKFGFISLDGEKEGLLISSMVVTATLRNPGNDEKFVAYHVLLLAATARGATAVEQNFNNIKYERLVVPSDAYDATMRNRVRNAVQAANPGYSLIDADATVIPKDTNLSSEEAVRNVIANATSATSTLLVGEVSSDAWVIDEKALQHSYQLEIKQAWDHFTDLTGMPVRGDVILEMSVLTGRNQNNQQAGGEFQYNNSQAKKLITQITGYIDLVSLPTIATNPFMGGGVATSAEEMKIFAPRFIITNLDAPEEACELPLLLQGLATVKALDNNSNWVGSVIQQHRNGAEHAIDGVNIRDLSVIGLEAPPMASAGFISAELPKPARLPLNSATTSDVSLASAIQTFFKPELWVSIDVPECGASSWTLGVFAAAARGDQNAIRDIFDSAQLLTDGRFEDIYKAANGGQMKSPVLNDNMYVNTGYYNTSSGLRDIRDGDYIAVANATADNSLVTINDWQNLQSNADVDPMFRLTETRRIQQDMFTTMVITGRAVRVTLAPAFLYALAAAIADSGLVYETKINSSAPQGTARMTPAYMRNVNANLGASGAFAQSGFRRNTAGAPVGSSFGRYSHSGDINRGPGSF